MTPETASNIRPIRWLMLALMVWGVYLALGTSRFARDFSDSVWKGAIVLGCVVAFLGLWTAVLANKRRHLASDRVDESEQSEHGREHPPWNVPCVVSLLLASLAAACLGIYEGHFSWTTPAVGTAAAWATPLAALTATLVAMIGLSDPIARRGKWLAMLALLAVVCLAVGWLCLQSPTAV